MQERIDTQAKSRVQAIMDARSKDYTKSQTILSKKTIVDGTFGRGEYQGGEELFAEKFNNVKFRDFHDNTRLNINNKDY